MYDALIPVSHIACQLKRTEKAIISRTKKLGLKRKNRHIWTPDEERKLEHMYPDSEMHKLIQQFGLTVSKIHQKAQRMGIHRSTAYLDDPAHKCRHSPRHTDWEGVQILDGQHTRKQGNETPRLGAGENGEHSIPAQEQAAYVGTGGNDKSLKRRVSANQSPRWNEPLSAELGVRPQEGVGFSLRGYPSRTCTQFQGREQRKLSNRELGANHPRRIDETQFRAEIAGIPKGCNQDP